MSSKHLSLGKCKSKLQWNTTSLPLGCLLKTKQNKTKQKHQKTASVGEDVEKLELSYTTRGLAGLLNTELPCDSEILLLSIS